MDVETTLCAYLIGHRAHGGIKCYSGQPEPHDIIIKIFLLIYTNLSRALGVFMNYEETKTCLCSDCKDLLNKTKFSFFDKKKCFSGVKVF